MSKNNNIANKRLEDLLAFSLGIMHGEDGNKLIEKHKDAIDNITPQDMLNLENKQMQMGISPADIKKDVEKVINVFFKSLEKYQWDKPKEGSFLYYLMLENEAYTFKLNQIKKILKSYKGREKEEFKQLKHDLLPKFQELKPFDNHYIKKENILFPYLEKIWNSYRPLSVMWSLHDDIRKSLKQLIAMLEDENSDWDKFNKRLGKFFSLSFRMIQKENMIVFPVATETVDNEIWGEMHEQSFEYPFPFIEAPKKPKKDKSSSKVQIKPIEKAGQIISETGAMSVDQALMVFNHLPVDITVVDENDKVLFFNRPDERFFPRSPAIIGRSVQNCHPPESVHVVEKIIEAFKKGEKDKAEFWIQMQGKFILIKYFALRNDDGEYKGVLEVGQEITDIKKLEGERRLLDWE
ncbi:MAG: PAS domain-containing protein [Bacteroidota bacterium]|nr:PAS domain-containing protein [Bacteroidota bacterium]